ncbi:MAG: hypothetical protein EOO39_26265 [Cytophagaceae bacterium]|nr:MAG: hypothetical protein EOO39_26265 [Cytophagaceae bacterium]
MEELTHSEETIMRVLWELGEGVVHNILDKLERLIDVLVDGLRFRRFLACGPHCFGFPYLG